MTTLSQQIRQKYELGEVIHMTDLENFSSILKDGTIFSKNFILQNHKTVTDISNQSVQEGRSNLTIECTGKALHDYVPLYWGKKTPMVSALRARNESLLFLMFSTNLLVEYNCVLSDGNARSAGTQFRQFKQLTDLDILDSKSINSQKYAHSDEIKRRKQAELLVLERLPLKHLLYVICHSKMVKDKVEVLMTTHGVKCGVYIGAGNYYFKVTDDHL